MKKEEKRPAGFHVGPYGEPKLKDTIPNPKEKTVEGIPPRMKPKLKK